MQTPIDIDKVKRIGSRVEALSRRHAEFEERIGRVMRRPNPDQLALTRLKREKLRIRDEMRAYEGFLRTIGHTPAA